MVTEAQLCRLLAWLSPAFPVGAYSCSHGLEWAVEAGLVRDAASLGTWIGDVLAHGGAWADAVLFARAHDAALAGDAPVLATVRERAAAMLPTAELALESLGQGRAFATVAATAWGAPALDGPVAYPIAVAVACAAAGVPLAPALAALLHAVAANLVSAGVRLVPLGQTDGQRVTAALEPVVTAVATRAGATPLDDLATATLVVDWCSLRHETQHTRLFRS
jgi:urease accessory protein